MTIIENLRIHVHGCKVAFSDNKSNDLYRYLSQVVIPRLGSYAIFLDLIDSLPHDHSLRGDPVTVEVLEDCRQLVELVNKAEEYRT